MGSLKQKNNIQHFTLNVRASCRSGRKSDKPPAGGTHYLLHCPLHDASVAEQVATRSEGRVLYFLQAKSAPAATLNFADRTRGSKCDEVMA